MHCYQTHFLQRILNIYAKCPSTWIFAFLRQPAHMQNSMQKQMFFEALTYFWSKLKWREVFPGGSVVKNSPANAEDIRFANSIPGWRRSPGGGRGNPLQYSCLENVMDRGAWWAAVHGVSQRVRHHWSDLTGPLAEGKKL